MLSIFFYWLGQVHSLQGLSHFVHCGGQALFLVWLSFITFLWKPKPGCYNKKNNVYLKKWSYPVIYTTLAFANYLIWLMWVLHLLDLTYSCHIPPYL